MVVRLASDVGRPRNSVQPQPDDPIVVAPVSQTLPPWFRLLPFTFAFILFAFDLYASLLPAVLHDREKNGYRRPTK
jgi:hypothetical protein